MEFDIFSCGENDPTDLRALTKMVVITISRNAFFNADLIHVRYSDVDRFGPFISVTFALIRDVVISVNHDQSNSLVK